VRFKLSLALGLLVMVAVSAADAASVDAYKACMTDYSRSVFSSVGEKYKAKANCDKLKAKAKEQNKPKSINNMSVGFA
jgi:ABC-type transporter MlaC component